MNNINSNSTKLEILKALAKDLGDFVGSGGDTLIKDNNSLEVICNDSSLLVSILDSHEMDIPDPMDENSIVYTTDDENYFDGEHNNVVYGDDNYFDYGYGDNYDNVYTGDNGFFDYDYDDMGEAADDDDFFLMFFRRESFFSNDSKTGIFKAYTYQEALAMLKDLL